MGITKVVLERAVKKVVSSYGFPGLGLAGRLAGTRHPRPRLHLPDAARPMEQLAIRMGGNVALVLLLVLQWFFRLLFAASADVALWAIYKSGPNVQRKVRSHLG
ncbi:MAG: hypothetical protein ACRD10_14650 [Terriglobia bacterium]